MGKLNCRGIGVVIDDKVPLVGEEDISENDGVEENGSASNADAENNKKDLICDIVKELKKDGVPLIRYREIPRPNEWDNLVNVAFMLIDWALINPNLAVEDSSDDEDSSDEVDVDITLLAKPICQFIQSVHRTAFAPVFVFSNQDEGEIKRTLTENGIVVDVPDAYVFVRPKQEMVKLDVDGNIKLFNEINKWILATPAIRLFATWGNDVLTARNQMFAEFYDKGHNWPSLLWKAYKDDNDDPAHGLSQVMFDNLKARVRCDLPEMPNVEHDEKSLTALKDVLALTVMLPTSVLPESQIGCGDLFTIKSGKFWLVVSCDCDCIVHAGESAESTFVQVVKVDGGCKPESIKMKARFSKTFGLLHQSNQSYLFPIQGKCFSVVYSSFSTMPLSQLSVSKRIGRVLPPYITDVRQRIAQWNQRVGFPKIPAELFPSVETDLAKSWLANQRQPI